MSGRTQQVFLNGVDFATVHSSLLLQHINEGDLKLNQRWTDRPGFGQMLTTNGPQRREITIEFAIRDGRDYVNRLEAFTAVCAWAYDGGWLEVSDRPGQKIYVVPSQMPTIGRLREWTADMSIQFVAGWYPFWEETEPTTSTLTGVTSGSTTLTIPGNVQSCLAAKITSSSGLTSITLGVAETDTEITIERETAITAGKEIRLIYNDQHLLLINASGTDLMRWRTGSDNLLVNPGTATINYEFSAASNVQLIAGGAWL